MASHRPRIKRGIIRRLLEEAGGKCANPGCPITRTAIHHIRAWRVYGVHDSDHMIAVCPSCHDEVHHGRLGISDADLYAWKKLQPSVSTGSRAHLHVDPAEEFSIKCGSVTLTTPDTGIIAFELSKSNTLSFTVEDGELMLVSLHIDDACGHPILKATDNRVSADKDELVNFEHRQGRIRVVAPAIARFISPSLLGLMRQAEPDFASGDHLTILDVEVVGSGTIRVLGMWQSALATLIITSVGIYYLKEGMNKANCMKDVTFKFSGAVTGRAFGFD